MKNDKIKCIIADDEPLARKGLAGYIGHIDDLCLIGECEDAMQLDSLLRSGRQPDLLFLDIEMPYISGLDYLSTLPEPPITIVTTAYPQHALRGFDLNVADYLLKPVSLQRFMQAVAKARQLLSARQDDRQCDFIFLRSDKISHKVCFSDIIYVEAIENYARVFTASGSITVRSTMNNMLESLPESDFLRIHKSYIVNMTKVLSVEGNMLRLPSATLQIGRSFKDSITAWIAAHS